MYQELIEKINPKPRFNLAWYKNEDLYSEGEIEDIIIGMIAENKPEDYTQAIFDKYSWSTFYHLTRIRKNILNWYNFDKNSSVLEIGCGMGAITNMLCEKCADVTAVELSRKRATATLLRCRDKENLEIIVGNLNDIRFQKKYDYITLIGVLEYQGSYTESDNPYKDFLKKIKELLKPDGKLLIAIENQYGLKYWCGAREDHTGIPFEGINQYRISNKKVRTFSKEALRKLINESGFENTYFYYPMPDYKLPEVIYSEDYLPRNANMDNMCYYYVPDASTLVAGEGRIYHDIIQNNCFEFFANSFLVECSNVNQDNSERITFAKLSEMRMPEYRVGTRFVNNKTVERFALGDVTGKRHLQQMIINENDMKNHGVNVCESTVDGNKNVLDFVSDKLCEDVVLEAFGEEDFDKIYQVLDLVYADILKSSDEVSWDKNILYSLNLQITPDREKYGPILKVGYLDMILRNAFWNDGNIKWFDQEWTLENVPAGYIMYRLLVEFYLSYPELNDILPCQKVAEKYNILCVWNDLERLNGLFTASVTDQKAIAEFVNFQKTSDADYLQNIKKIMNL